MLFFKNIDSFFRRSIQALPFWSFLQRSIVLRLQKQSLNKKSKLKYSLCWLNNFSCLFFSWLNHLTQNLEPFLVKDSIKFSYWPICNKNWKFWSKLTHSSWNFVWYSIFGWKNSCQRIKKKLVSWLKFFFYINMKN